MDSMNSRDGNDPTVHGLGSTGGGWGDPGGYQDSNDFDNVVQIIVPDDMISSSHGHHELTLSNSLNNIQTDTNSLMTNDHAKNSLSFESMNIPLCTLDDDGKHMQLAQMVTSTNDETMTIGDVVQHKLVTLNEQMVMGLKREMLTDLSLPPQPPLPLAHFLRSDDRDANFYNEIYHLLNSGIFPPGISDSDCRTIRKRASNYSIDMSGNGLLYGHRIPKEVVTNSERQRGIVEAAHVDVNTVQAEPTSQDAVDEATNQEPSLSAADRVMRIWKTVQVQVLGPYLETRSGNVYVVTISDDWSRWVVARGFPLCGLEASCATFLFEMFCMFGFAHCQVLNMDNEMFGKVKSIYEEQFSSVTNTLHELMSEGGAEGGHNLQFINVSSSHDCNWAGKIVNDFCRSHELNWDTELNLFLFRCRTASGTGVTNGMGSPFHNMFARCPTGCTSEEEKENANILEEVKALDVLPTRRRRLQSSTLECRHCDESFTSKISFRIHQRKHTEEARRRGTLEGERPGNHLLPEGGLGGKLRGTSMLRTALANRKKRRPFGRGPARLLTLASSDWSDSTPPGGEGLPRDDPSRQRLTHNTVSAVKALLMATRDERCKRGKYLKYSAELRDEIAAYALAHGNHEAVTVWSSRLGGMVSESTVRNFVRRFRSFTPQVKEEIGRFAVQYGLDAAARHFSQKLGHEVRQGLVRKFKKFYLKKYPPNAEGGVGASAGGRKIGVGAAACRLKRSFSQHIKDEIGRYAAQCGISAAIEHFSEKLQFSVKESTVRKFRKLYLSRSAPLAGTDGGVEDGQPTHSHHEIIIDLHGQQHLVENIIQTGPLNGNFVYATQPAPPYSTAPPMGSSSQQLQPPNGAATAVLSVFHPSLHQSIPSYQQPMTNQQQFLVQPTTTFQPSPYGGFVQVSNGNVIHTTSQPMMSHQSNMGHHMNHHNGMVTMGDGASSHHGLTLYSASGGGGGGLTQTLGQSSHVIGGFQSVTFDSDVEPLSLMKVSSQGDGGGLMPPPMSEGTELVVCLRKEEQEEEEEEEEDGFEEDPPSPPPIKRKNRKGGPARGGRGARRGQRVGLSAMLGGGRGNYATYSPELRAEIGRYAAENGNLAAVQHFRERLGLEIPESTVRGLKDKYLIKRVRGKAEVTAIGFAQRGRPMRLGKYDDIVQECIRELVDEGEKISSFLAIATAKQVLMQYEPNLLEEFGGPVKLNPTWAKSFLKRIGLHNAT